VRSVRRTALAASAAVLTLLVTACGGSSDDGGETQDSKPEADRSASGSKPEADRSASAGGTLGVPELEKVALAQADVTHGEVTTEIPAKDDVTKDQISTDDDSACAPLVRVQAAVAQGEAVADVKRSWKGQTETPSEDKGPDGQGMTTIDVNQIMVNVASYEDGGAEQALKELNAAAEKCAGGFEAVVGGDAVRFTEVARTADPKGGDEGFAATLGVATGKETDGIMKLVVVRKGATLASFGAVNLSSVMTGADFEVPADVIDAQVAKLG
jgi:hypothetical protein